MREPSTFEKNLRPLALAEWGDLGDDEPGELVDGYLVEEDEVGAEHDIAGAWLIWLFQSWLASRGGGNDGEHRRPRQTHGCPRRVGCEAGRYWSTAT
jgi:hypothetical protein